MTLDLTPDDCQFLRNVLERHLEEMRHELQHTDDRHLHRELRADVDRLEQLTSRVTNMVGAPRAHA